MCFDHDSRPPIAPIAGGALDSTPLTLVADDGNRFAAFSARAAEPTGAGIIVLPDVRGLHAYYEDLALRFAEHGIDAIAIDYYGRTAGASRREPGFDNGQHVTQLTVAGLTADVRAAAERIRAEDRVSALYTIGFCVGGRVAFNSATMGLDLAGVIGFYGWPVGPHRSNVPAPVDVATRIAAPVLALFGGGDEAIPPDAVRTFEAALKVAGVESRVIVYPDAPHSFFDKKADEYSRTSESAWAEVLAFIDGHRTGRAASRELDPADANIAR
jgi:carboxymethylenebutenolidase